MENPIILGPSGKTKVKIDKKGRKSGGGNHLQCRILRPSEFVAIHNMVANGNKDDLTNLDMCLLLGARYEECRRIQAHPEWFDKKIFVEIDEHKTKRVAKKRWIRLSNKGKTLIPYFFDCDRRLPNVQTWDEKLKRWADLAGIGSAGVTSRMMRKTWESWLMFYYPEQDMMIAQSQGHTLLTAMQHYINMPFSDSDINLMKEWVEGWRPEDRRRSTIVPINL